MSNNVDISEVVDFSNDLQEASSDMKASLDAVQEQIEKINGMDSFSGKAAKEAKTYFGDFHLTILESFRGLFDALGENLQQHIDTFESDVDGGDAVIIKSKDLEEIKEDMQELFEKLQEQDEDIHDTIDDVTDISSATPPSFSDIDEWKRKATKKLKELDEDLASFTGESDETDVNAIMEEIKGAMSHAKTREGKARFANFEGASKQDELAKIIRIWISED